MYKRQDQFKYIIDQFPDLKEMGFTGIGESFLNKDFIRMIQYVKSHRQIFMEIFDSFYYMDEKNIRDLIATGIEKVYCSMDAATKNTYESIRVGSKYERIIENIKLFDQVKKELDLKYYPQFWFHYIINKLNIDEVLDFIELIHSLEIDVYAIQFTRLLHPFKEIKHLFVEIPESLQLEAVDLGKKYNISVVWNANVPKDKPPANRCIAWMMPFIFVDGTVIPCCPMNEANRRWYQRKYSMGNIFQKSFKEIWYGEEYMKLRECLRNNRPHPSCIDCPLYKFEGE